MKEKEFLREWKDLGNPDDRVESVDLNIFIIGQSLLCKWQLVSREESIPTMLLYLLLARLENNEGSVYRLTWEA